MQSPIALRRQIRNRGVLAEIDAFMAGLLKNLLWLLAAADAVIRSVEYYPNQENSPRAAKGTFLGFGELSPQQAKPLQPSTRRA